MVIGRDFTFLETREAFPDGSYVLALLVVKCFDFFVVDMFASACLSSTLSHPQRAGACFCCLRATCDTDKFTTALLPASFL